MWKPLLRFRKGCATHLSKAFAQGTLFPHSTDAHVYGAAFGLLVGPNEIQPSMVVEHGARSGLGAQPDASKLQVVLLRHWHHGSRLVIYYVHGRGSEHLSDPQVLEETHMSGAIFLQEGFVRNDCGQRPRRVVVSSSMFARKHVTSSFSFRC